MKFPEIKRAKEIYIRYGEKFYLKEDVDKANETRAKWYEYLGNYLKLSQSIDNDRVKAIHVKRVINELERQAGLDSK